MADSPSFDLQTILLEVSNPLSSPSHHTRQLFTRSRQKWSLLFHNNDTAQSLHHAHDLLRLVLTHALFQHLGRTLHELLAVHQTQAQQALDLLDDLRFRRGVEALELEREQGLFLRGWRRRFVFRFGRACCCSGGCARGCWSGESEVGDVKTGLLGPVTRPSVSKGTGAV